MRAPLRAAGAATAFLTRIPLPSASNAGASVIAGAPAFPFVGAALGALVGATAALGGRVEPRLVAGALAVGVEALLTGALHLDGLADSADGLGGSEREHALEIMRDHAIGAYGASALVLDLLLKAAALAALRHPLPATIAALALSRAVALPLAAALPYARPTPGTGLVFGEGMRWPRAIAAMLIAAAIAVLAVGTRALALIAAAAVIGAAVGLLARRRLGGITGDTLGAAIELTATTCLLVAAAVGT
jgi:adenosylcobinamide-GDP ribazoletransferase